MNKIKFEVEIDDDMYNKYNEIIEKTDKNINQIIEILIKKTIEEDNIDWLFASIVGEVKTKNRKKANAIDMFRKKGYKNFDHNTTFATKNTDHDVYWLNPNKKCLSQDWYIILNDNINKILHLLFVPSNSIYKLIMKNDRAYNVSIKYNDENFSDIQSGQSFKNYLQDSIKYDSLV